MAAILGECVCVCGGGGSLHPNNKYMGMCRCVGYGFQAFLSRTGYGKHAF